MEFDPVGSAEFIPDMIKNDTLIEVLDQDQLSECLKHTILNIDDSLYIIDRVQSKYDILDRYKAIHHITTHFGEGDNFDPKQFVEFIKSLGQCLHFDILDYIAAIVESAFSKIEQLSSTSQMKINPNIEELKTTPKTGENFDKIYEICQRIATEKDKDAMSFAIREKFVDVTVNHIGGQNIFTKAAEDNKQDLVRLLIESGIDINFRDGNNYTALIHASGKGHLEVVKLLLAVPGIDVNAKGLFDTTALIDASRFGHIEIVKLLLKVPGIDINAKNGFRQTAVMLAWRKLHDDIAKLLQAHGAIY